MEVLLVLLGGLAAAGVGAVVTLRTQAKQRDLQADLQAQSQRHTSELRVLEQRHSSELQVLEQRHSSELQVLEQRHTSELQAQELEYKTHERLRLVYAELLVAQRRSREASVRLAQAGGVALDQRLAEAALTAHDEFIATYHELYLDATDDLWHEARGLRDVLGRMLELAQAGDIDECKRKAKVARHARQNLQGAFRQELGHDRLQERKDLGEFDKVKQDLKPG